MSKKTKNEAMNMAATVAVFLGAKVSEANGTPITPKNGRELTNIDGFITYLQNDDSGADFITALAAYYNTPYEHEFEKAAKKSEEKRALAEKAREAIAAQFKMA